MKCEKCGEFKTTVAEIRNCSGCQDGTSQQIGPDVLDIAMIENVLTDLPGLGNRFKPGDGPKPEQILVHIHTKQDDIDAAREEGYDQGKADGLADVAATVEAAREEGRLAGIASVQDFIEKELGAAYANGKQAGINEGIEVLGKRLARSIEALQRLSTLGNGDQPGNSDGNTIAQNALQDIDAMPALDPDGHLQTAAITETK